MTHKAFDGLEVKMENWFKHESNMDNATVKEAYARGFYRAYHVWQAKTELMHHKPFSCESKDVRVGDLLWLFNDGYGHVNCNVSISNGDKEVVFEDFPDLSEEISNYDDYVVTHAYFDDCCLYIHVPVL